jgi:hypothetical protein
MIDVTPHEGGILCACYDCRERKGRFVRVPRKTEIRVVLFDELPNSLPKNYDQYELLRFVKRNNRNHYIYKYVERGMYR